jgi:hypothetical protein
MGNRLLLDTANQRPHNEGDPGFDMHKGVSTGHDVPSDMTPLLDHEAVMHTMFDRAVEIGMSTIEAWKQPKE